jgi:hypothetical protein
VTVWDTAVDASEFIDQLNSVVEKRYGMKATGQPGATSRTYTAAGRTVEITTAEVAGRPVVMYVDVPAGAGTKVIDLNQVKLKE